MGNESSKSNIENQQLIMQLQHQLLQQKQQYQQQNTNIPQMHTNNQNTYNSNLQMPVISPVELQSNSNYNPNPNPNPNHNPNSPINIVPQMQDKISQGNKLLDILGNKQLMKELDHNPNTKRKLLDKLLNEHRHMMTSNQVLRITQILHSLPPAATNISTYAIQDTVEFDFTKPSIQRNRTTSRDTSRDTISNQLQTQQQYNTIDSLTKHYKTEAEEEETRFKLEEDKRRHAFAETQRQRRLHYQASLSDLEKSNIDALKLFKLQTNYTIEDLKIAYKKLAMQTHPDKTGGNTEKFQLVTKCYMSLLEKYKARETEKPFNDLRNSSKTYIEDQTRSNTKNKSMNKINDSVGNIDKTKFDSKLFNKIYEQNKLWESGDDGYGTWFTSNENEEAPDAIFSNKFNINIFNTTFEDYKDKLTSQSGAIQEYKDPQELVSCSTGFTDIDIYARKVDDFSKPLPIGNGGKTDLAYTDLKTAYSSRGAFIDPSKVAFKEYKNVDELKKDRSNIKYNMTPEQTKEYEMKKLRDIEDEEKRQYIIRQRDTIVSNSYSNIHEKMLGYRGNASY